MAFWLGIGLLPVWQESVFGPCPCGHHLPLQSTDCDPLHASLPMLKGVFDSKTILNFYFFPFPNCFSLISPQRDITLITAVKGNSVSITLCHPFPLGLNVWNLSPKWKEGIKGKEKQICKCKILFIYLFFFLAQCQVERNQYFCHYACCVFSP